MPTITHVVVENPNLEGFPFDLLSISEYKDLPRKYPCLPDDGTNGTDAQDFCQAGCNNEPLFQYVVEPTDVIRLQFRFPDLVNSDPSDPDYGWYNGNPQYFIRLEVLGMDGTVLWNGPISAISQSYGVFLSDAGPVQNVNISVTSLLNLLPPGTQCFFFRTLVVIAAIAYSTVNYMGTWDGDPPYTVEGTIVVNMHPDHFGIWELQGGEWVLIGVPQDGEVLYVADSGLFFEYTQASNVVAGGDDVATVTLERGSLIAAFANTTSFTHNGFPKYVWGMKCNPSNADNIVAVIRETNFYEGSPVPGASNASKLVYSTDGGATWTDSTGATCPENQISGFTARSQQIAWAPDGSAVWKVDHSGSTLHVSTDGGATWTDKPGPGEVGASIIAYSATEVLVTSGATAKVWRTTNAGTSWTSVTPGNMTFLAEIGHGNGDVVVVKNWGSDNSNKVAVSSDRGVTFPILHTLTRAFNASDIIHEGGNIWIFGFDPGTQEGVLFKSTDNGGTFNEVTGCSMLGRHAQLIGGGTILCAGNDGTVYVTYDGGTTWDALPNQPADPAWSVAGELEPGTWEEVPNPGLQEPGEDLPTDTATTMAYRLRKCDEPIVHFVSEENDVDCLGYVHTTGPGTVLGANMEAYQHDFKVAGEVEIDELPIVRDVTQNGRLKSSIQSTKARLRTYGLPLHVVQRIQAVFASADFEVDEQKWDTLDTLKKNNEEGAHWYLDTTITRKDCDTDKSCV